MSNIATFGNEVSTVIKYLLSPPDYEDCRRNNGGVTPYLIKNIFRNLSTQTAISMYLIRQLR